MWGSRIIRLTGSEPICGGKATAGCAALIRDGAAPVFELLADGFKSEEEALAAERMAVQLRAHGLPAELCVNRTLRPREGGRP